MVSVEYMLDAATAKLVREIEATKVNEAQIKPYYQSTTAKSKAKKNLDQRPAKKASVKAKSKKVGTRAPLKIVKIKTTKVKAAKRKAATTTKKTKK